MNKGTAIIGMSLLMALLVIASAGSGFGEYASPGGRLNFTIQLNHSGEQQWVLWNGDNYTLGFYVVPPPFNGMPNSPILEFSTLNGLINESSGYVINITVKIPFGTTINKTWTGYAEAVSFIPNSSSGGASIQVGTDKLMQVNSEPSTTSTTSTSTTSSTTTTKKSTSTIQSTTSGNLVTSTSVPTTSTICFVLCLFSTTSTTSISANQKHNESAGNSTVDQNHTNSTSIGMQPLSPSNQGLLIIGIMVGAVILVGVFGFLLWRQGQI